MTFNMVLDIVIGSVVPESLFISEGFRKIEADSSLGRSGAIIYRAGNDIYVACPVSEGSSNMRIQTYEDLNEGPCPLDR